MLSDAIKKAALDALDKFFVGKSKGEKELFYPLCLSAATLGAKAHLEVMQRLAYL